MNIHDLDTPAVLIDIDALDRNLSRMASYCRAHRLSLRPHTKTHKIPEIAHLQIQYGAPGITVAKLGEAEVMADAGIDDILIVYPLWGEKKWAAGGTCKASSYVRGDGFPAGGRDFAGGPGRRRGDRSSPGIRHRLSSMRSEGG